MPNELTNPNNVVTEERLAQFYQQILPYLGGMPDVLANKFNRADLYSTDEKLIGRWIDGKPLYQKTVQIDNPSSTNNYVTAFAIQNLGALVKAEGIAVRASDTSIYAFNGGIRPEVPSNWQYTVSIRYYSGNIEYLIGNYNNVSTLYITVQYTKTTDSAVEIGSDTDYSTTEKIVGTWIDGKPLYQKTAYITSGIKYSGDMDIGLGSLNIENIVSSSAFCKARNGTCYPLNFPHPSGGSNTYTYFIGASSFLLNVRKGGDQPDIAAIFLTIQYTKTSS